LIDVLHVLDLSSADTASVTHPNSEVNVIQTLCSTTKAVINRFETKVCVVYDTG